MVAQLAGHNHSEHVVETTAWGDGEQHAGGGGGGAGGEEQRYSELLDSYACEAPGTLKSDKAKFHYIKGQYYQHSEWSP